MASEMTRLATARVVAVEAGEYLAQERARADRRVRNGWSRAEARQNQQLPYGGSFLSPGDAERLDNALRRTAGSNTATTDELQGAALLSAVMTSGRSVDALRSVVFDGGAPSPTPAADTLRTEPDWSWSFEPGAPTSRQGFGKVVPPQSADRPSRIALPCTIRTRTLLSKLIAEPKMGAAVFAMSIDELRESLRRYVLAADVRASTRRIEGWLFQRLVLQNGGDAGIAALITGRRSPTTQTLVHYTALECADITQLVTAAVGDFDSNPAPATPPANNQPRIGSRYAPIQQEVGGLSRALSIPLRSPGRGRRRDPMAVHNAVTTYTIALAYFSTGCRPGQRLLPDEDHIDPATGFVVMDDKPTPDNFKSRVVWVVEDCREQLRLYRAHLAHLAQRVPALEPILKAGPDPFYLSSNLQPRPVTRSGLRTALAETGWPYPLNAGRHFLRSSLAGKVSTETLHALLGHWHIGTEAWGAASALDPLAYRAELMAELEPLIRNMGWLPRSGL